MKQTVEEYVSHAKSQFPFIPTDQLISMVILHFDIPDKEAKQKVEEILKKSENKKCKDCYYHLKNQPCYNLTPNEHSCLSWKPIKVSEKIAK